MTQVRDPGLQPERTTLAWRRTALAVALNATLLLRAGVHERQALLLLIGAVLGAGAFVLALVGMRRDIDFCAFTPRAPSPFAMGLVAGQVVLASAGLAAYLLTR